jgi:hypothetical protein
MSASRRHGRGKQGMADWSSASWAVWEGVSSVSPSYDEMRKNSRGQAGIHPAGHGSRYAKNGGKVRSSSVNDAFSRTCIAMVVSRVLDGGGSGSRSLSCCSAAVPRVAVHSCVRSSPAPCRRRRCLTDASKSPRELYAHRDRRLFSATSIE